MEAFFGCHVWLRVHMDAVAAGPVTKNIAGPKWIRTGNLALAPIIEAMGARDSKLLMGHGEDAVPAGWRFVEKIFLATLPVGACRAVVRPLVENGLEGGLGVQPVALLEESAS